jgi:hypothetical protein
MPDVDGVLEIEVIDQFGEIVGVMVHIVAVPRLTGTAMAAEVMTDAAIAVAGEEEHLVLESIRRQRPAMAEDDRPSLAPVLESPLSRSSRDMLETSPVH